MILFELIDFSVYLESGSGACKESVPSRVMTEVVGVLFRVIEKVFCIVGVLEGVLNAANGFITESDFFLFVSCEIDRNCSNSLAISFRFSAAVFLSVVISVCNFSFLISRSVILFCNCLIAISFLINFWWRVLILLRDSFSCSVKQ